MRICLNRETTQVVLHHDFGFGWWLVLQWALNFSSETKEKFVLQFTEKTETGSVVHRQKRVWYYSSQTKDSLVLQFTDKRETGIAVHRQKRDWYCSSQTKKRLVLQFTDKRETGIAVHRQKRVCEYDIWLLWIVEIISMCPSWPTHNDTAF